MSGIVNYYEILGVTPQSTIEEMKTQRDRLLQAHHPDHNKSPNAEVMMKLISEAWAVLSDPQLRKQHDGYLRALSKVPIKPASRDRRPHGTKKPHYEREVEKERCTQSDELQDDLRDIGADLRDLRADLQAARDYTGEMRDGIRTALRALPRLPKQMREFARNGEGKFIEEFHVRTTRRKLFQIKQLRKGVKVLAPTFVRWRARKDARTCDVCKALDLTTWVLEDNHPYPVRFIARNASKKDRVKFHEKYLKADGPCRCKVENISDRVSLWWQDYMISEIAKVQFGPFKVKE